MQDELVPADDRDRRLMTADEVARLLAVSKSLVYSQVRAGSFPIPHRSIGGVIRFPARFVYAYVDGEDLLDDARAS